MLRYSKCQTHFPSHDWVIVCVSVLFTIIETTIDCHIFHFHVSRVNAESYEQEREWVRTGNNCKFALERMNDNNNAYQFVDCTWKLFQVWNHFSMWRNEITHFCMWLHSAHIWSYFIPLYFVPCGLTDCAFAIVRYY